MHMYPFYPVTKNMRTYPKKKGRWVCEMIERMIECVREGDTMHLQDGIDKTSKIYYKGSPPH